MQNVPYLNIGQFLTKLVKQFRIYSKMKSFHNFLILTFDIGVKVMKKKNYS